MRIDEIAKARTRSRIEEDNNNIKTQRIKKYENRNWLNIFSFCFTFVLCYMIERNRPSWCTFIIMISRMRSFLCVFLLLLLALYLCAFLGFPSFSTLSLECVLFEFGWTFFSSSLPYLPHTIRTWNVFLRIVVV